MNKEIKKKPEDWDLVTLNDVSFIIGDGIHATPKYVNSSDIYFINGNNLTNGSVIITENTKCVNESELKKHKKELNENTILMSINGTIGNLAFYNNEKVILGKSVAYINLKNIFDLKFIFYFLQTSMVKSFYENELTGTTIRNLSLKSIRNTPIILPKTKEEKSAIAEALSNTDELIQHLDNLITKKKNIKQGVMQELLTGKKRLSGFNEKWKVKKLGDIAQIISGGTPSTSIADYWNGSIKWCIPTDITSCAGKYLTETERTISRSGYEACSAQLLPAGSLLLCSRATIGEVKIAMGEICTNQGFKSLICKDGVNNEFLYYVILTMKSRMIEKAIGSTFLEISKKDTSELEILIPSEPEQIAIASILSDIDTEIEELEKRRNKYIMIKKGMMQQLLTGNMRLR